MRKLERITNWRLPRSKLDSMYGRVRYADWYERECKRLSKGRPGIEHIIRKRTMSTGKAIAIFKRGVEK